MSNYNDDLLSEKNLEKAQARNFAFLETFADKTYRVCGVPVLQCLNYELIQVLNNMYLQTIIPEDDSEKESIAE